MKKFLLPLIVLIPFAASVYAQQGAPSQSAAADNNAQSVNAPQASAEPATPQDATKQDVTPTPQDVIPQDAQAAPSATPQAATSQAEPEQSAKPQPATAQSAVTQPAPAPLGADDDKVIEEIVARVNNTIITRADLRRNQEQIAFDAREQNISQSQVQERQANALRDLIDQQLLVQKAAELGISADADLVKRLDEIRKQMKVGTLEELQKAAESQGVHWEEFKQRTKENILTQKVIGSEVGARIQITREEAQKYYDDHKAEFTQPERVRLSEILIANDPAAPKGSPVEATPEQVAVAEAKIKELHQQLKSGAKFDELARKESNGPTAEQGGDLGYFKRNDLAKTLEEQTFKLKSGEITPPIHTRQGFIILMVNDHIEAGTPPFERVREQIHERLYMERVQPALREYMSKLRDDAYIDVKAGYTDTGASPNQSKLIYATDSGPRTKQVRGKLGMGKKKTIVVTGNEKKSEPSQAAGTSASTSALGQAKAEAVARDKAAQERKSAEETAAAKAAAEAAEQEKMSHMSNNEKKRYLAQKKKLEEKEAKEEAKQKRKEEQQQKEFAAKEAQRQAADAKPAKNKKPAAEKPAAETKVAKNKKSEKTEKAEKKTHKPEKKSKEAATNKNSEQAETSSKEAAADSQPQEKKKIHWF